jgi:alpha-mannosidase
VVERPIGIPASDAAWVEQPRPEVPQRDFTSVTDGQGRLTIAARGLPEVEVLRNADGNAEIALTLLRCVGWLSRDDFSTRQGHAGPPFTETPGAQMPGEWAFDYAIIPGKDALTAYRQAAAFVTPMRAMLTSLHPGILPARQAFIQVDPPAFRISAVKMTENGDGWLVRGYNLGSEDIQVTLRPWKAFERVELVNLAEETLSRLETNPQGEVSLPVGGRQVVSFRFG